MRIFSISRALFLLFLLAPLFTACSDDDPTDPGNNNNNDTTGQNNDTTGQNNDTVTYPIVFLPKSVENKSAIMAFVREGNNWREITSENPAILTNESFAEYAQISPDDDFNFVLNSTSKWLIEQDPDNTYSYIRSGDKFTFAAPFGIKFYATGHLKKFNMHMISGVTIFQDGPFTTEESVRLSLDPAEDKIDALLASPFPFPGNEGDTLAYQTFDVVYEVE